MKRQVVIKTLIYKTNLQTSALFIVHYFEH